jgi:hypothetical protein
MNRPKPINAAAALVQLLDEYNQVTGKEVDEKVAMICGISAERAMRQDWEWQKNDNPNWPAQLNWKS